MRRGLLFALLLALLLGLAIYLLRRQDADPVRVASRLVPHENVMAALADAEIVRTTEELDPGTRRGQGQTLEADRHRFSAANGVLSRPVGTPPFCWLVGHRPGFTLDVLAPQERELTLQLSNGTTGPQRVTVLFNGHPLGDRELAPGAELVSLTLPVPPEMQVRGVNRVELAFDRVELRELFGEPVALPISGVLTHVRFRPRGAPDEPAPPPPFAGAVTEGSGAEARSVLLLPCETSVRIPLDLPDAPRVGLRFTPLEVGLPLELSVVTDAGRRTLLRTFQPGDPQLTEVRFDLTPWAGEPVILEAWARDDGTPSARDRKVRLGGLNLLVPQDWRDLMRMVEAESPPAVAPVAEGARPSFLVVTLDAFAARWVSALHRGSPVTPELDALLARGIAFPDAEALSSYTLASVGTLLTGQSPLRHGVALLEDEHGVQRLRPDAPHLPALLAARGWRTAAFMTNPNTAKDHGFAEGFETFDELFRDETLFREGVAGEHLVPRLEAFLKSVAGKPFLAWVHVFEPHAPYVAPADLTARFVGPYDGPVRGDREWINAYRTSDVAVDEAGWAHLRDLYAARVALADRTLGALVAAVERAGRAQDTAIVVLADHGESLGEHGALEHGDELWREQLAVPLVFVVPGSVAPGTAGARRAGPASLADVAPTLLTLAGVPAPASMEGTDLLAGALDRERPRLSRSAAIVPMLAWSRGDWKLVVDLATRRRSLYDLKRDPREEHDLYAERPATAALMLRELCAAVCAAEARAAGRGPGSGAGDAGGDDAAGGEEPFAERERRAQIMEIGYMQAPPPPALVNDDSSLCAQLRALLVRL